MRTSRVLRSSRYLTLAADPLPFIQPEFESIRGSSRSAYTHATVESSCRRARSFLANGFITANTLSIIVNPGALQVQQESRYQNVVSVTLSQRVLLRSLRCQRVKRDSSSLIWFLL